MHLRIRRSFSSGSGKERDVQHHQQTKPKEEKKIPDTVRAPLRHELKSVLYIYIYMKKKEYKDCRAISSQDLT